MFEVVRSRKIDEFEEAIADHYEGICCALKGDLNSARSLYAKANTIFYYRTNNRNRSYRCMFDLGVIELKYHFEVLTDSQKVYLMLTEALVMSAKGKMEKVQDLFVLIDEDVIKVKDKALLMVYKLQKIIALKITNATNLSIIRKELIPFFIETNQIQYMVMAVEYMKKVEGGEPR